MCRSRLKNRCARTAAGSTRTAPAASRARAAGSKLERLYRDDDWAALSAGDPGFLTVRSIRVPYVVFENRRHDDRQADLLQLDWKDAETFVEAAWPGPLTQSLSCANLCYNPAA